MSNSQDPLIQLNFNDVQLTSMLTEEHKTSEAFQADVLVHLHSFLETQREKIGQCLMSIKGPYIHVTMRMNAVPYDEDLQDACSTTELDLAQNKGWANVNIVLIPNAGSEATEHFHNAVLANERID